MSAIETLLAQFRTYLEAVDDAEIRRFLAGVDWAMPFRPLDAQSLPVVTCLNDVDASSGSLLSALVQSAGHLHWGQTYDLSDFGVHFLDNYGWVELFGTRGHFASGEMAGGFLLLGPAMDYPDHHHVAEEIYVPLTGGSLWSKDTGPFIGRLAGEVIHHPSDIPHAMRTTDRPLVALYLWRGGPLAQKSVLVGQTVNQEEEIR